MVGVDKVVKGMKKYDDDVYKGVKDVMRAGGLKVARDAKIPLKKGHGRDTGHLVRSITSDFSPPPTKTRVRVLVGSKLHYAPHVEYGTKPHFPPPSALAGWTKRHGGGSPYVVARAISRKGTTGIKYLQNAYVLNADRIWKAIRDEVKKVPF